VANNYVGRASGQNSIYFRLCGTGGVVCKNNIIQNTDATGNGIYIDTITSVLAGNINANAYDCAGSAIVWGSQYYATSTALHLAVSAQEIKRVNGNLQINSVPNPSPILGSPVIGGAENLSGLAIPELNSDKSNIARPSGKIAWDIGPYQYASVASISPPQNAVVGIVLN
jgi:hypothetical protein